jgi:AcrR family transcriptional regulator
MMMNKLEESTAPHARVSAKSDTLIRLIQAAREEFAAKGLSGAKIENIAHAAGVTKQLVYHYFQGKDDLFSAVLDDASAQTMPKLVATNFDSQPPPQALRTFLETVFDQYRSDPLLGPLAREAVRFREGHRSPRNQFLGLASSLAANFDSIVQRGIASGDFCPDIDLRTALAAASLLLSGGFTNRYTASALLGYDAASDEGMDTWRDGAINFILAALSRNAGA